MPLKDGIDDATYEGLFRPLLAAVMERFRPEAIVLQSGAAGATRSRTLQTQTHTPRPATSQARRGTRGRRQASPHHMLRHAHALQSAPGADSLAGDKLGEFRLSIPEHARCHAFLRAYGLPMLVLGGGGYKVKVLEEFLAGL